jgi:hypothetical protein
MILAATVLAAGAALPAAANPPIYRYGEAWWNEYESDPQTALLLHFGPAQISGRDRLEAAVAEKKRDEKLFSLDADDLPQASAGGLETMSPEELKPKQRSVDETPTAAGTIRDYSNERQIFPLASGFTITPDGRFGRGLACSGAAAQKVTADSPTFIECWIRFDDLPAKEQCIFSCGADESRLLLRPDGRLELRLKKPHGVPNPKLPPAQVEAILARDASILSPDPVAPKTWTHVAVWNRSHPMPGGGEPFDAVLTVNGSVVANYMSERHTQYGPGQFFGSGKKAKILIGNSAAGDQGFVGTLDELRVSKVVRELYERPPLAWRDARATRTLQFNRPFFRADGTVLHASVDSGTKLDIGAAGDGDIRFDLRGEKPDGLLVDGVRGKGWLMDAAGRARVLDAAGELGRLHRLLASFPAQPDAAERGAAVREGQGGKRGAGVRGVAAPSIQSGAGPAAARPRPLGAPLPRLGRKGLGPLLRRKGHRGQATRQGGRPRRRTDGRGVRRERRRHRAAG